MEALAQQPRRRWHLILSGVLSVCVVLIVWFTWPVALEALRLVRTANPWFLAAAVLATLGGYLASSQVFRIGLARSGTHIGVLPLWAMTMTAIVISQLVPAGGIGSYAFFISAFKRRGVSASQAAVLTGLEALSYLAVMILWGSFSICYIVIQAISAGQGARNVWALVLAALVAVALLLGAIFVSTRSEARLRMLALAIGRPLLRLVRRPQQPQRIRDLVSGFVRERDVLASDPWRLAGIVAVQVVALAGHSLAIWLVLASLGVFVGPGVPVAAFGTTLILSTFNVLPGGGGTVEAVLVAVLLEFDTGTAAIPAAVLFRLMNYWALLPVAALASSWLLRERAP